VRELSEKELAWKRESTRQYQRLTVRCRESFRQTEALTEVEPDRKRLVFPDVLPLGDFRKLTAK